MSAVNKFAIVLGKLKEVVDKGEGVDQIDAVSTSASWSTTKVLFRKTASGPVAYIKGLDLYSILEEEEVKLLEKHELFVDDGATMRIQLNNKVASAVAVKIDALEELAQASEASTGELAKAHARIKELEREMRVVRESNASDQVAAEFYEKLGVVASKKLALIKPPAIRTSKVVRRIQPNSLGGVPVLFLSDWHWDEVVQAPEIMNVNLYNRDIAHARANRVIDKSVEILHTHMSGQHYEGIVVLLGGDMVSGNIHDELRETNEYSIMETVVDLAIMLANKLRMIAQEFQDVLVPCISGNHGRTKAGWSAKNKQKDNYDFGVYKMVQKLVEDVPNIRFLISDSTDVMFQTYHVTYLATHGDQFKNAGGADGLMASVRRGDAQKRKLLQAAGGYDYLVAAHFHTYRVGENAIINGSLKGMDEFAFQQNYDYEPARQALWIAHPHYGVGNHMAIYGDEPELDGVDYPPLGIPDMTKVVRMFK